MLYYVFASRPQRRKPRKAMKSPIRRGQFLILAAIPVLSSLLTACGAPRIPHPKFLAKPSLTLSMPGITTLNPILAHGPGNVGAAELMYDGLVSVSRKGTPVGDVATGWTARNGGRTWIFALNPYAKWWNGRPLTAHDVVWTFLYYLNPNSGASNSAHLRRLIRKVRALNTTTVMFRLARPDWAFPVNDASTAAHAWILPAFLLDHITVSSVRTSRYLNNYRDIMGSGPFRPALMTPTRIQWLANPRYFHGVPKTRVLWWDFQTGRNVDRSADVAYRSVDLSTSGSPSYTALAVNSRRPPFNLTSFRELLWQGINRSRLVPGQIPALGPVPPGNWAYARPQPLPPLGTLQENLAHAGYRLQNGLLLSPSRRPVHITIQYRGMSATERRMAQTVAAHYRTLGLTVALVPGPEASSTSSRADLVLFRMATHPFPTANQLPTSASRQDRRWAKKCLSVPRPEIRRAIWKKIQDNVASTQPAIFLYWNETSFWTSKALKGFSTNPYLVLDHPQNWIESPQASGAK